MALPSLEKRLMERLESMDNSAREQYYKTKIESRRWHYEKGVSETLLAVLRLVEEETNPVILKRRYGI